MTRAVEVVVDAPLSQVHLACERMRTRPVPWVDRLLVLGAGHLRPSRVGTYAEAVSHTRTLLRVTGQGRWFLRIVAGRIARRARHYLRFGVRTGAATVPLRTGSRPRRGG